MKTRSIRHSRFPFFVMLFTLLFLYVPLVMVAIASFNESKFGGHWTGFSFRWYEELFTKRIVWEALSNSLLIAVISTVISTILGTLSALALYRSNHKLKWVYDTLLYTPLVVPDVLTGISLLLLFVSLISIFHDWAMSLFGIELELGMTTIIIAHVTFCMSYVAMVVLSRLREFDHSLIEAAYDLGASGLYTFFRVTLPIIFPGIIAGSLLAFTLSIDDFVITFFVKGAGDTTLPVFIQASLKRNSPAVLNALSVVFLIVTFIVVFTVQKITMSKQELKK